MGYRKLQRESPGVWTTRSGSPSDYAFGPFSTDPIMARFFDDFRKFIDRGNIVDMAVGLTVGVAFSAIAKALVNDLIMPVVGFAINGASFRNFFWVLKAGKTPGPYPTLAAAQKAGAVTLDYGDFINTIVTFFIIAFSVFLLVRAVNDAQELRARQKAQAPAAPTTKSCPRCCSTIPIAATRCPNCTSELNPA